MSTCTLCGAKLSPFSSRRRNRTMIDLHNRLLCAADGEPDGPVP